MSLIQPLVETHMRKIDALLQIIRNFEWHKLSEIAEKLGVPEESLKKAIVLLAQQKIVKYDAETNTVALNPEWKFLVED